MGTNDHVQGTACFYRKYRLPVFYNEDTAIYAEKVKWNAAAAALPQKAERRRRFGNNLLAVPHDAASTVGYVFKSGGGKCTYLTDVGFA